MVMRALQSRAARATPFYYGWVILALSGVASYSSRPLMSLAVLTVFVVPMTEQLGWTRAQFSGAVSLGGMLAVVAAPLVGPVLDRYGSGLVVGISSGIAGLCAVALGAVSQIWMFYLAYVPGRTVFASPLELGTSVAVSNWFIRRRPLALALNHVSQGSGLSVMPLVAQAIIGAWGWETAWYALGTWTVAVGVIPAILLMARRPEDLGVEPDGGAASIAANRRPATGRRPRSAAEEINFTPRQAMGTRSFWLMMLFGFAGFIVQGGVSLHQAPHFTDQGVPGSIAVFAPVTFAISQVPSSVMWSVLGERMAARFVMTASGLVVASGAVITAFASGIGVGLLGAFILGFGVGGLHMTARLTWADYFGRTHLGKIRSWGLAAQVGGQVLGPTAAGFVWDLTGNYQWVFTAFGINLAVVSLMMLTATRPGRD
ncbi:MAG: MFS transporter [Chloroflexi bacterium]|nr:MFS transporter [Chloroflexota bacterium]MYD48204.1 MFS transporter [Chloroflexota bacterium]